MKAKLLEKYRNIPSGTICEVHEPKKDSEKEFYDLVTPDGLIGAYKWRFEVLPEDPIEEKKKQIQEAQKTLEAQKQNLLVLEKELADLTAPKVGSKYETCNCKYVLAQINAGFVLICYEGYHIGKSYIDPVKTIKEAFCSHEEYFIKLD